MHRAKIVTASGVLLVALATGCGGSSSSSTASPSTPASAGSSVSAGTSPSASATAAGVPFTSEEWHFAINLPKQPEQQALNQTVEGVKINGRIFDARSGDVEVAVSVVQFPAGQKINVDGALRGAVAGGAKTSGGTVVEQHGETFQGKPAREGQIRVPGASGDYYLEAFVDGTRLYNIVASPKDQFDAAKASFQFR